MRKSLFFVLLSAAPGTGAKSQELDFPHGALKNEATLTNLMPLLAKQAIAIYREPDRSRYLNSIFRLQIVAGQYTEAAASLRSLIELRRATNPG